MKNDLRRRSTRLGLSLAVTLAASSAIAASASAFSIDSIAAGPGYTGTYTGDQRFLLGTGMTLRCNTSTLSGATHNVAGDLASSDFLPAFSSNLFSGAQAGYCSGGLLPPYKVTTSGNWRLTATGNPSPGVYQVALAILPGSTMTWKTLTSPSCTISFGSAGNSGLTGPTLRAATDATGTTLTGRVDGITYTVSLGCPSVPAGTRTDGSFDFGGTGNLRLADVAINP